MAEEALQLDGSLSRCAKVDLGSKEYGYAHLLVSLEGVIAVHCQQQMGQLADIVLQRPILSQLQCLSTACRVQE